VAAGEVPALLVRRAAVVALLLALVLSLASGLLAAAAHGVALALAHSYNLYLKRTPLSVVAYGVAFALAPAFVTLGLQPPRLPAGWVIAAAALLGAGAHFTQTLGDHDRDLAAGVRGLPQRLGRRASVLVAGGLLGAATVAATVGPGWPDSLRLGLMVASLALVMATVGAGMLGRYRDSFRLTMAAAGAAVLTFLVGTGPGFS
jgi:4-hydroxybenzoate polyprenyltransferase